MGGGDDDGKLWVFRVDAAEQVEAIDSGHTDIADDDVRLLQEHAFDKRVAIGKALVVYAGLAERTFQYPANRAVIIHDPDLSVSLHGTAPWVSKR